MSAQSHPLAERLEEGEDPISGARQFAVRTAAVCLPLCLLAYCLLDDFPILSGIGLCIASVVGIAIAIHSRNRLWSPILIQLLFLLLYPICCAHLSALREVPWWLNFSYKEYELSGVIGLSVLGQVGIVLSTLLVGYVAPPIAATQRTALVIEPMLLLAIGFAIVIAAAATSFATGVGVIGYAAVPKVPFVAGFIVRLGNTTVPMVNLACLTRLVNDRRGRGMVLALVVIATEGVLISIATLSRLVIVFFVVAPVVYLIMVPAARALVRVGPLLMLMAAAIVGIVVVINNARNSTYDALSSGAGYSRDVSLTVSSGSGAKEGDLWSEVLKSTDIYRRLMGFPDLIWVWASHYEGDWMDCYYALWHPPNDNPNLLNEHIGIAQVMNVSMNSEMNFGGGVGLFGLMATAGTWFIVPGVMVSMSILFAGELLLRRLLSFGPRLAATIYLTVNLWQGLSPIGTVFSRFGQMFVLSVLIVWVLERKVSPSPVPAIMRAQ